MKIWKNTSTLDGYDENLNFTTIKDQSDIALIGSKPIILGEFQKLKGIFRAGIGRDNVPELEALDKGVLVRYPSQETIDIIYNETATFTCNLIFRMLYSNHGTIEPWSKKNRNQFYHKSLLVMGTGNIGKRVVEFMRPFMNVITFDIMENDISDLPTLISKADCITLHIPMTDDNKDFIDKEKLAMMKDNAILINTARGSLVDEEALFKEISSNRLIAAFDVFWQEPYYGKLKKFHPKYFFMSPHVASNCNGFLEGCRKGLDALIKEIRND